MLRQQQALGAVLMGGASRRYGSPKAMAAVGGVPLLDRVLGALAAVVADPVLIVRDPHDYEQLSLPRRADAVRGAGPLGGVYTALLWARELGRPGALVVACDMPFLSAALLNRLLSAALDESSRPDAVVPASTGPQGCEPLCAYYAATCIPALESALSRERRGLVEFLGEIDARRVPLAEVQRFGDPATIFLNVNSPTERARAEQLAGRPAGAAPTGGEAGRPR